MVSLALEQISKFMKFPIDQCRAWASAVLPDSSKPKDLSERYGLDDAFRIIFCGVLTAHFTVPESNRIINEIWPALADHRLLPGPAGQGDSGDAFDLIISKVELPDYAYGYLLDITADFNYLEARYFPSGSRLVHPDTRESLIEPSFCSSFILPAPYSGNVEQEVDSEEPLRQSPARFGRYVVHLSNLLRYVVQNVHRQLEKQPDRDTNPVHGITGL
ncbi:MAG: hypothetical protein HQK56_16545 [Deltaproteobacteria bacterium]|nr:hypothetical protein [Deltaproteobacteria bacterium]